jgi:cell division protein FtsZ
VTVIATGFDDGKNFELPNYGFSGNTASASAKQTTTPPPVVAPDKEDDDDSYFDILSIFNNKRG